MTIPDSLRLSLEAIPTGRGDAPPPVNNACVPDQFNKLDADAIEKTRVLNALLTLKLKVQEKVLQKYKTAAERSYLREKDRVKRDLSSIGRKLPNYADMPNLETKVKRLKKKKKSNSGPLHNCVFTTKPEGIKGISAERDDRPFCDRFFHHHIPTKAKMYKKILPSVNEGFKMLDFRPRPRNLPMLGHQIPRETRGNLDGVAGHGGYGEHVVHGGHVVHGNNVVQRDNVVNGGHVQGEYVEHIMNGGHGIQEGNVEHGDHRRHRHHGRDHARVIPPLHALDDNFMVTKSYLRDEDDDCKTV